MLKKLTAIIMSIAIMFTAGSVLAEVSTKDTGMVVYTDDFEHLSITEDVSLAANTYLTGAYTSDVFASQVSIRNSMHLLYDSGKDGTKALKLTATSGNHSAVISARPAATDSFDVLEMSYDLKMSYHTSTTNNYVSLGATNVYNNYPLFAVEYDASTGKNYIENAATSEKLYEYDSTKWYKVVIKQCNTGKRYGYITDEDGTVVAEASRDRNWSAISPAYNGAENGSGAELIIDNIVFKHYNIKTVAPSCELSSVDDNNENVIRNAKITFVFDQEIADDSVIGLLREDGEEITEVTEITTEKISYNTLVLKYEGLLDRKTGYVLSFEGVTNGEKACSDEAMHFTTEDLHIWNDVSVFSAEENEENNTLTDIRFEIGDKYGYPTFHGSVMAVVYQDGKMIKADIQPLENSPTGELVVAFDLGTVTEDSIIGIILLDTVSGPIPLAGGTLEL